MLKFERLMFVVVVIFLALFGRYMISLNEEQWRWFYELSSEQKNEYQKMRQDLGSLIYGDWVLLRDEDNITQPWLVERATIDGYLELHGAPDCYKTINLRRPNDLHEIWKVFDGISRKKDRR
jgi:hypothetical protein